MWSSGACVDLVYIFLLHDYMNCSHTNCSTVEITGTPFDTHCKHQIFLQCLVCPERECRCWFREMDCHILQYQILLTSHLTLISSALMYNARSTHLPKSIMTHAISGLLNIHLFRAAEHSVRPPAPPSSFTTALCCHV